MRVLSPGELAGKTRFVLRCLGLVKRIMSECGQLEGGTSTPSVGAEELGH